MNIYKCIMGSIQDNDYIYKYIMDSAKEMIILSHRNSNNFGRDGSPFRYEKGLISIKNLAMSPRKFF